MSRRSVPRRPSVPRPAAYDPEPEAIALRIHQIACVAGVIARHLEGDDDLGHVLYLIEETLLDVEARVERLRPG